MNDDKNVTIMNILIDFRDVGGERVVTLETHPRDVDLLKITCGLNAKSQAVTSLKEQKFDNCD